MRWGARGATCERGEEMTQFKEWKDSNSFDGTEEWERAIVKARKWQEKEEQCNFRFKTDREQERNGLFYMREFILIILPE